MGGLTMVEMVIDENNIGYIPSLGTSFQLNETAKEIILMLKQGKSKDEIVEELAKKYNKDWREVFIDVTDFMEKLKIYGVIQ
ncbi:MAG: PqqD family protein [Epsilonproteobacteria bacterium]|jgi:fatty acid-binding protein DegV|nr:PqqD family protein [Campylobacterota bacterium]NPA88797.1 PqqD family protein [Campylobacterota bacterium]